MQTPRCMRSPATTQFTRSGFGSSSIRRAFEAPHRCWAERRTHIGSNTPHLAGSVRQDTGRGPQQWTWLPCLSCRTSLGEICHGVIAARGVCVHAANGNLELRVWKNGVDAEQGMPRGWMHCSRSGGCRIRSSRLRSPPSRRAAVADVLQARHRPPSPPSGVEKACRSSYLACVRVFTPMACQDDVIGSQRSTCVCGYCL